MEEGYCYHHYFRVQADTFKPNKGYSVLATVYRLQKPHMIQTVPTHQGY